MTKLTLIDILAEKDAETFLNDIWYGGKNKEEKRHHIGRRSQEGNLS